MRGHAASGARSAEVERAGLDAVVDAPAVDLRVVLFTVSGGALRVALAAPTGASALPRGTPVRAEPLDAAARRVVRDATGLREQYLEQLYTLSDDGPTGWTLIVAYLGLVCSGPDAPALVGGRWHAMSALPPLATADRMIIDYALLRLRAKLGYTTIAFHLMPPTFTLSELQHTYEAVLGRELDKRNFRRRLIAANILAPTDAKRRDGSHRPALLYRFRAAHDRDSYLTPPWSDEA